MSNISLDTTSFSEQLGIFDFFNILISGTTFIFGLSIIHSEINKYLWDEMTVCKSLGIIILIYITGLILQEVASILDGKWLHLYKDMNRSLLKESVNENCILFSHEAIIKNSLLRRRYRKNAEPILEKAGKSIEDETTFKDDDVNGLIFSVCQYYLAVCGKDKKIEKMRALFNMAKMLMVCFALLTILNLLAWYLNVDIPITLWNLWGHFVPCNKACFDRFLLTVAFSAITLIFFNRSQKIMRRFLLILLGMYDAMIWSQSEELGGKNDESLTIHIHKIDKVIVQNERE